MADYHVGCGIAGIYAGTMKKNGEWKDKSDVTTEAMSAVAQRLFLDEGVFKFNYQGKKYSMSVTKIED